MKAFKSIARILMWLVLGALLGAGGMALLLHLDPDNMKTTMKQGMDIVISNILIIQGIVAGIAILAGIVSIVIANRLLKHFKVTDEDDEKEEKIDGVLSTNMFVTSVYTILAFLLFGFSVDQSNPAIFTSIGIFLGSFLVIVALQMYCIKLIKVMYPTKKGDPSSMKFQKEWIESCDEAEQHLIYKSAYKTYMFMNSTYLFLYILVLFTKLLFETGNYPIILMSLIWLISTLHYMVTSNRLSKKKK